MKKKINFKQLELVIDYDGNKAITDASKELASIIFNRAANYDDFELGRAIHQDGEVEIDKEQAQIIKNYVASGKLAFFAQKSIGETLDNLFADSI